MNRRLSRYLWIVCMHGACLAAQQTGSFAGKVSGPGGQALPGATVTLLRDGVKLSNASTGLDGAYRLSGIAYGRYSLSAALGGYKESVTETITLAGDRVAVDFSLQSDDFIGTGTDQPGFRPSGVEGTTAPSGYSAGASAEDAATLVTRVSSLKEAGLSLQPSTAETLACNREGDLINALHAHPGSFHSNHQLGVFYFEHGDINRSIGYLEQASAIEPLDLDNARWLALAYIQTNQSSKAIAEMQSLVTQHPGDPALLLHLAQVYEATGDRPRAIAQYLAAAKLNLAAENLFPCGMGLVSLGAVEESLPLWAAATTQHPTSARLWMGLGIAQSLRNRSAESARSLLRAVDLDPGYLPAWFFLAALPPTAADEEIRRRLAALVVANSASAEAQDDYALALWKNWRQDPSPQREAEVESRLKLAIERDPAFPAAHFQLGTVYEQAGDYVQAASELERAVQLDPDNAAAHYRLAQAYQRTNRPTLADRELAKFKTMHSDQPQQDETIQAGLRAFTAQFTRPKTRNPSCHDPH